MAEVEGEKAAGSGGGIPINPEIIERFKSAEYSPDGSGEAPDSNPEIIERFKSAEYSPDGSGEAPDSSAALAGLNEAVSYGLRTLDKLARRYDERMGTDPEIVEITGELSVLVAKRKMTPEAMQNSPEIFLGTVLSGVALEKLLIFLEIRAERRGGGQQQAAESEKSGEE